MANFADILLPLLGAAIATASPRAGRGISTAAGITGQMSRQRKEEEEAAKEAARVRSFKENIIPLLAGIPGPQGEIIRQRVEFDPRGNQGAASAAISAYQRQQAQAAAAAAKQAEADKPTPYTPMMSEQEVRSLMGVPKNEPNLAGITDSQRFSLGVRAYNGGMRGEDVRKTFGFGEGTFPDGQSVDFLSKTQANAEKEQAASEKATRILETKTEKQNASELRALQKELAKVEQEFKESVENTSIAHNSAMYKPGTTQGTLVADRFRKAKAHQFELWNQKRGIEEKMRLLSGTAQAPQVAPQRTPAPTLQSSHVPNQTPTAKPTAPVIAGRLVRNPKTGELELSK